MSVSKILGATITSLTLTFPVAKAENQLGGAISNSKLPLTISAESTGLMTDLFEKSNMLKSTGQYWSKGQDLGGSIINEPFMSDKILPSLQIYGTSSLTNKFGIPVKSIPLNDEVKNVKKIVNTAPKITDSIEFNSEITYGDNQTTNVLVSGLSKVYKFFKTKVVDIADDTRIIKQ